MNVTELLTLISSLNGKEPVHCIQTFVSVAKKIGEDQVCVCDLFVLKESLVFVPRGCINHNGSLLQSASGVIGAEVGLPSVGYALTSTMRSVDEKFFSIRLNDKKKRDLGLSVEDRIRRQQLGVVIPRKTVHSIWSNDSRYNYVDGCIIEINLDKGTSEILVSNPKEVAKSLNEWLNGQLQDGPDKLNVNLAQVPTDRIMNILFERSRNQILLEKEKDAIKSVPEFTERLYAEFLRYGENDQKCLVRGILLTWKNAEEFEVRCVIECGVALSVSQQVF